MRPVEARYSSHPPVRQPTHAGPALLALLARLRRAWADQAGPGALVPELLRCESRFRYCLQCLAQGASAAAVTEALDRHFGRDAGHRAAVVNFILRECKANAHE